MPKIASRKHHYIPVFYLKQWTGSDGLLCEFARRGQEVRARMTHPSGTAYKKDLYTIEGLPDGEKTSVEDRFLNISDQIAHDAFRILLDDRPNSLTIATTSGWSRFIISLIQRNPEKVEWLTRSYQEEFWRSMHELKDNYTSQRREGDPTTYEEFMATLGPHSHARGVAQLLETVMDSEAIGNHINGMHWSVVKVSQTKHEFITSDRPVIMTNGVAYPRSHIAMPLSPRMLFVATNTLEMQREIQRIPTNTLVITANSVVASQAQKFVYAKATSHLRFVENRLGRKKPQFIAPGFAR